MRNFFKAFLVFLFVASIAQLFSIEKKEVTVAVKEELIKPVAKPIVKKDTTKIKEEKIIAVLDTVQKESALEKIILEPFSFTHKFVTSSKNTKVIYAKELGYFKQELFEFLNKHQQKEIVIKATYLKEELLENGENYGLARAKYLKNKLVNYGILSEKIIIETLVDTYVYDTEGYYADGISIGHRNMSNTKFMTLKKKLTDKVLHSYFVNNTFIPNRTLLAYVIQVKEYLKEHTSSVITIIGHTDDVGEEEANNWIGLERAKSVKNYFVKQGIDTAKITVVSMGETQPIATNTTKRGRATNRRIEVKIN